MSDKGNNFNPLWSVIIIAVIVVLGGGYLLNIYQSYQLQESIQDFGQEIKGLDSIQQKMDSVHEKYLKVRNLKNN